jgi:hypothetical protein
MITPKKYYYNIFKLIFVTQYLNGVIKFFVLDKMTNTLKLSHNIKVSDSESSEDIRSNDINICYLS